jgi:hypothetical protein
MHFCRTLRFSSTAAAGSTVPTQSVRTRQLVPSGPRPSYPRSALTRPLEAMIALVG